MAFDETRFSHITVTPDDEDDVVIRAGAPDTSHSDDDGAGDVPADDAPAVRPVRPASEKGAPSSDEAFRETTIEDLEPPPMPTMQKAVIAVAVVLFVVAVAYLATH
ncbi:hypothetical protein [Gordonibacter sp. An230]|uniref:hypothetical protein n=1 Tax=Gordonibacter sp. An230 TaxID=1965592 RepID=UPI000B39EDD4|nr:hypothetical protein [Gordonibacter sp. An230]